MKSLSMSGGLVALLHPQLLRSPSRQDRLSAWTTPAAEIAWVNAASRLAEKSNFKLFKHPAVDRKKYKLGNNLISHTVLMVEVC